MPFTFSSTDYHAFQPGQLFLGRDPQTGYEVGLHTEKHAITIASARTGKGAALIIPNLLRWPHNALCIDPSGENVEATWQARENMGQTVRVLDPFRIAKIPDRLRSSCNLLAAIKPDSVAARADIRAIADGLVMRYKAEDATWDNGAVSVLAGMIAFVLADHPPEERNLYAVRQLLTLSPEAKTSVFEAMAGMTGYGNLAKGAATIGLSSTKKNQEFVGGAIDHSEWLDDDAMRSVLTGCDFHLSELKTSACSVFLVLPIRFLADYGRFLRLFVRCALNAMEEGGKGGRKCLFILDEFFSVGHIDQMAKAVGGLPKNGVHLWPFLQDLGQLTSLYGMDGAGTFFGNSDAQIFFGTTDAVTLKYVAERIGQIKPSELAQGPPEHRPYNTWFDGGFFETEQEGRDRHNIEHQNRMAQYHHTMGLSGRSRLTPDEVQELVAKRDGDKVARSMIVFGKGNDVFNLQLAPYFEKHSPPQITPHYPRRALTVIERLCFSSKWMFKLDPKRSRLWLWGFWLPFAAAAITYETGTLWKAIQVYLSYSSIVIVWIYARIYGTTAELLRPLNAQETPCERNARAIVFSATYAIAIKRSSFLYLLFFPVLNWAVSWCALLAALWIQGRLDTWSWGGYGHTYNLGPSLIAVGTFLYNFFQFFGQGINRFYEIEEGAGADQEHRADGPSSS